MVSSALTLKIVGLVCIEALGLLGGFLPFYPKLREGRITAVGEAFSGGVFLAAALLDLVPDSFEDFDGDYPFPALMTVGGFILSLTITRYSKFIPFFNFSRLARCGNATCACGDNCHCPSCRCHNQERQAGYSFWAVIALIVGFASAGPFGIAVGIGLESIGNETVVSLLTGLAAGTFLFVAVEVIFGLFGGEGHSHEVEVSETKAKAFLLFVMLSFHSVVEGLALGIQESFSESAGVFIAIMCHKTVEAFSIGFNVVSSSYLRKKEPQAESEPFLQGKLRESRDSRHNSVVLQPSSAGSFSQELKQSIAEEEQIFAESLSPEKGAVVKRPPHHAHLSTTEALVSICVGVGVFSVISAFV